MSKSSKHLPKAIVEKMKELEDKYADALEVLRQIDRLPMESYHLEKFKSKYPGEV